MNHWKTVIDNHATYLRNKLESNFFFTLAWDISNGINFVEKKLQVY